MMFNKIKSAVRQFASNNKASAEAISQALLFILVLSTVTFLASSGNQLLSDTRAQQTIEQNTETAQLLDQKIESITTNQGYGIDSTAQVTQRINTYDSTLLRQEPTKITIGTTTIESDPIVMRSDRFNVVYDTGMIGIDKITSTTAVKIPTEDSYVNQDLNTIPLITTNHTADTMLSGDVSSGILLIEREYSPETRTITASPSSTVPIEVETQNADLWEKYLRQQGGVSYTDTTGNTVRGEIVENSRIYHYQVKLTSASSN